MTSNLGTFDRALRIVLGMVLLALTVRIGPAIFHTTASTRIVILVGTVLIATAATKFCPLYRLLGFRTCKS